MALKFREELVGKRFLAVKDSNNDRDIAEWEWRAGVVRAVLHGRAADKDLQVLVEFDGVDWQLRESIRVHEACQVFLVEKALVWARRPDPSGGGTGPEICWPALNFVTVVDRVGLASSSVQPIEFFLDHSVDFVQEKDYCCQDSRPATSSAAAGSSSSPAQQPSGRPLVGLPAAASAVDRRQAELDEAVRLWLEYQDGQSILLTTPTVLMGYRVKVYRTEGTTQWYTAVIQQYNCQTKKLTILDDTVLEEHNEDPATTQIVLLDGVVESILKGIDQRIIPRRRVRDKELTIGAGSCGSSFGSSGVIGGSSSSSGGGSGSSSAAAGTQLAGPGSTVAAGATCAVPLSAATPSRNRALHASSAATAGVQAASSEPAAKQDLSVAGQHRSNRKSKSAAAAAAAAVNLCAAAAPPAEENQERKLQAQAGSVVVVPDDKPSRRRHESGKKSRLSADLDRSNTPGASTPQPPHSTSISCSGDDRAKQSPTQPAVDGGSSSLGGGCRGGNAARRAGKKVAGSSSSSAPVLSTDAVGPAPPLPDEAAAQGCRRLAAAAGSSRHSHRVPAAGSSQHSDRRPAKPDDVRAVATAVRSSTEASAAVADCGDARTVEASIVRLQPEMHYKKLHLLSSGSDASAAASAAAANNPSAAVGAVAAPPEAQDKPGSASPAAGSESAGGAGSDKLSDCGSADAGSTSGYSTATVDALSPHRRGERASVASAARVDILTAVAACDPAEPTAAAAVASSLQFGSSSPPSEPVQVYRDPELLRKDEEARCDRLGLGRMRLNADAAPAAAAARGASAAGGSAGEQASGMPGHLRPAALPGVDGGLSALVAAAAAAAQGRGSALVATAGPQQVSAASAAAAAAAISSGVGQAASAQHLLSSVAAAQQLAHLEAATRSMSTFAMQQQQQLLLQQDLAALAQLQLLCQSKYGGGAVGPSTLPWQYLAYEEFMRRSYRDMLGSSGVAALQNRERTELPEKERSSVSRGAADGYSSSSSSSSADAVDYGRQPSPVGAEACPRLKHILPTSVKVERDVVSAAESAVDQHFTESLRLATKKAPSSSARPLWQHPASSHSRQPPLTGYGMPRGTTDKLMPDVVSSIRSCADKRQDTQFLADSAAARLAASAADPSSMAIANGIKAETFRGASRELNAPSHPTVLPLGATTSTGGSAEDAAEPVSNRLPEYRKLHGDASAWSPAVYSAADDPVRCPVQSAASSDARRHQEPNFSLYGFQPLPTITYISQEKLHRRLDKPRPLPSSASLSVKDEPRLTVAPSPLGGDDGGGWLDSVSSVLANSEHAQRLTGRREEDWAHVDRSPTKQSSTRRAPATATTATERRKQQVVKGNVNRTAAPSDGPRKQAGRRKDRGRPVAASRTPPSSSSTVPAKEQPSRVSNSRFDPYQHLIQDGLVPNPMYSRSPLPAAAAARCAAAAVDGEPTPQLAASEQLEAERPTVTGGWRSGSSTAAGGSDGGCGNVTGTGGGSDRLSSGSWTSGSRASVLPAAAAATVAPSIFAAVAASSLSTGDDSSGVVRHSFKSLLESAMHKAYMQDLEEDRKRHLLDAADADGAHFEAERSGCLAVAPLLASSCGDGSAVVSPMGRGVGLPPPTLSPNGDTRGSSTDSSSISRCSGGSNSSSATATTAAVETDSDTLSAPSPPVCVKSSAFDSCNDDSSSRAEASALAAPTHYHRHSDHHHHPKLKKAWLQRHSGEGSCEAAASAAAGVQRTATVSSDPTASSGPSAAVLLPRAFDSASALPTPRSPTLPEVALRCATGDLSTADEASSPIVTGRFGHGLTVAERFCHGETTSSASEAEVESRNRNLKRKPTSSCPDLKTKKKRMADDGQLTSGGSTSLQPLASAKKRSRHASPRSSLHKQCSSTASSSKKEESDMDTDDSDTVLALMPKRRCKEGGSAVVGAAAVAGPSTSQDGNEKPVEVSETASVARPSVKTAVVHQPHAGQSFRQAGGCCDETPKLQKCRECKLTQKRRNQKIPNIFCRFVDFRRLRLSRRGILTTAGFSEPSDAEPADLQLWVPCLTDDSGKPLHAALPPLGVKTARYIIANVGDEFCRLVEQEKECQSWANPNDKILWKRAVQGVRETCDVCDTTLFNMHWVCLKCGFVVCMDCYRVKRNLSTSFGPVSSVASSVDEKGTVSGNRSWFTCSSGRQPHDASKLVLTQIIPGDALLRIGDMIHEVRKRHGIRANCPCGKNNDLDSEGSESDYRSSSDNIANVPRNGIQQQLLEVVSQRYLPAVQAPSELPNEGAAAAADRTNDSRTSPHSCYVDSANSCSAYSDDPLSLLADVAFMARVKVSSSNAGSANDVCTANGISDRPADYGVCNGTRSVVDGIATEGQSATYDYYQPRNGSFMTGRREPVPICQLKETSRLYPGVPHSWLCGGRLLRLHDPRHDRNFTLFHQRWRLGQPVMVSSVTSQMKISALWSPAAFSEEFGHVQADLVNCRSGCVLTRPIKDFWDGFENQDRRIMDTDKQTMLLKLKDWPPGDDFSDMLPTRFKDLTDALPMPEYTHRDGLLNLASRLPDFFVKPDLGPKMYNAYGMAKFPHLGTTNLHLDISDAVNVMVYVASDPALEEDVLRCINESDVDDVTRQRLAQEKEIPGALWHIWDACDADKIRDLLNKVAAERGERVEPYHDPIHDQSWYLDSTLRERLRKEYGVNGFAIVQCSGDAVFIPAGAPHQVQNLNSCIKVAEDFVSPEHLHHCFKLTQEFRHLSSTHSNHEDKLQVKNIIYHAVKDAVAVLSAADATVGDSFS